MNPQLFYRTVHTREAEFKSDVRVLKRSLSHNRPISPATSSALPVSDPYKTKAVRSVEGDILVPWVLPHQQWQSEAVCWLLLPQSEPLAEPNRAGEPQMRKLLV
jgi:hypothetical protein